MRQRRTNAQKMARSPVLDRILADMKPRKVAYTLESLTDDGLRDEIDWQTWVAGYLDGRNAKEAELKALEARRVLRNRTLEG